MDECALTPPAELLDWSCRERVVNLTWEPNWPISRETTSLHAPNTGVRDMLPVHAGLKIQKPEKITNIENR